MDEHFDALVLRNISVGDQKSLITVLTKEKGKQLITCHGAKKITGKNMPAVQPFCYSELICSEKNHRYTLKESSLKESFFSLRCDLESLTIGSYFLEVALECAREDENEEELLSLVLNSLYALTVESYNKEQVKAVFELRLLSLLGCAPQVESCVSCGRSPKEPYLFSPSEGGLLCPSCVNESASKLLPMSVSTREALLYILEAPEKRIFSFRLSDKSLMELKKIARECIVYTFDKEFESLKFYEETL